MLIEFLEYIRDFYWGYVGFWLIVLFGVYFTVKARFFQFKVLGSLPHQIRAFANLAPKKRGINPIKLYFASIGGSIGLGNIINVSVGLVLGGPGILFWLWVASFSGMLVKYSEIYLSIKYRVPNQTGGYDGGAMHFVRQAFGSHKLSLFVATLFCIYGVEMLQFSYVCNLVHYTYSIPKLAIVAVLLLLTFYCSFGGIKRLANISTILMPFFMLLYIILCLVVILCHCAHLPSVCKLVMNSAFTGHAALGGFIGSGFLTTVRQGISKAVYSGDIGVGYDAIIQAETELSDPAQQARFSIFSLFTDTFICSMTVLVALTTGAWTDGGAPALLTMRALHGYFPAIQHFMTIVLFLAGFTTIIAFLTVGYKASGYISSRLGRKAYTLYAVPTFILFSFVDTSIAALIMDLVSGLLVLINVLAIIKLRNEIHFR